MGTFDDLTPQQGGSFADLVPAKEPKKAKSRNIGEWIADTFGPNGNLRGSEIGSWMHGMADPVVGAVQLVANASGRGDAVNQAIAAKEKELADAKQAFGREGADISRIAGNVTAPTNLIAASKIPLASGAWRQAGQGAAIGAASGAMEPVTDADNFWGNKAKQTAAGAIGGGIATPVLSKLGGAVTRRAIPAEQGITGQAATQEAIGNVQAALREMGQDINDIPPQQLKSLIDQVTESLKQGKTLDPAAILRKADFEAAGMQPTLGQITRDPAQFAREMNLRGVQGVGDPLMQRFTQQNQQLTNSIGQFAQGAGEKYQAGRKIIDDLSKADDFFSKHVSSLYKQARESAGKELDVPLQGLAQDYARILRDFGDKLPSGVRNNLDDLGLLKGQQTKVFTVEDADRLLKVINSNSSNDPAVNAALTQIRGAVKNAVNSVADDGGVFAPAVKAAKERFALHDAAPALRAASEGAVSADDFVRRFIVGGKTDEVNKMAQILGSDARNEAKAQIGEYLRRAAFGENTAGDKAFAQESFNKALSNIGTDKLRAFFSPEEIVQLQRLGRVGAYMTSSPARAPVNSSNTAGALFNLLQSVPGVGRAVSAANAIGNTVVAPVRNNALVRTALDATPPVTAAPLTEAQSNMLAKILAGGSAVGGGLLSPNM